MQSRRLTQIILCIIIVSTLIGFFYYRPESRVYIFNSFGNKIESGCPKSRTTDGWISASLYNEFKSYLDSIKSIRVNYSGLIRITNENFTITPPLRQDYIRRVDKQNFTEYPYSSWKCTNTSSKEPQSHEYCVLKNIYFVAAKNTYYFYRHPLEKKKYTRSQFTGTHGTVRINIIDGIDTIKRQGISAVLTKPIHVVGPLDLNYARGFLERCGSLFWAIAEFQSHPSYVDPSKVQLYYASNMHNDHGQNEWLSMLVLPDGIHQHKLRWSKLLYGMFSIYPLLTSQSFDQSAVMFKYMIFTGSSWARSATWGIFYSKERFVAHYPFNIEEYRRAYLAYSEWILNNFELKSKFELTPIQNKLQETCQSENVSMCYENCQKRKRSDKPSVVPFTGEWIIVLNSADVDGRGINNADELIEGLLRVFPDQANPYLRVWPNQVHFDDDLYQTARLVRSARVLIGVHGSGLSNALFMRPGAILYEIDLPGCRMMSFTFRRWADVFNLQYGLWSPGDTKDSCFVESSITVNIDDIISDIVNLLENEKAYRNGFLLRAFSILLKESSSN